MTQLNLIEIFSIIMIHWVADFVLQTDKMAKGKSKNWKDLLSHTTVYSLVWFIPFILMYMKDFHPHRNPPLLEKDLIFYNNGFPLLCLFVLITFICHTITDYFTSRLNSKLWAKGEVHNFFVSVGFDQVLHYVQLFLTYALLKQYL